jgi:hypothetical protein
MPSGRAVIDTDKILSGTAVSVLWTEQGNQFDAIHGSKKICDMAQLRINGSWIANQTDSTAAQLPPVRIL